MIGTIFLGRRGIGGVGLGSLSGISVPSNQAPAITVPGSQSAVSSLALSITGTSIADGDGNAQSITIGSSLSSLVSLASTTGLTGSGDGMASLSYSGSLANINTALATLTYTAIATGTDTITITTNDGVGGQDTKTITVTVTANGAAQFNSANTRYFTRAYNSGFNVATDRDFSFVCWFYKDSNTNADILFARSTGGSMTLNAYTQSNTQVRFTTTALGYETLIHSQALTTGVWYFAAFTYDSATRTMSVSTNDGTPTTRVTAAALIDQNDGLAIGKEFLFGQDPMDGRIDGLGYWNTAQGGGGCLSAAQITSLYNSGAGKTYRALTAGEKVGLVSWWEFADATNLLVDSHGTNTLTNVNSVTVTTGKAL